MNIELSVLKNNDVLLISDRPMPDIVDHIEFHREQKLFLIKYKDEEQHGDLLMHYEVPDEMVYFVEKSKNIVLYTMFDNHEPIGYRVPLQLIGGFR